MLAILFAVLVPLTTAVLPATILGIVKDGTPMKKDWWTS